MNKKSIALISLVALLCLPLVALAANTLTLPGQPAANSITSFWGLMVNILHFLWPIFVGVAILMFIIAGFLFVTSAGDPGKTSLARQAVVWGIVGVFVGLLSFSMPYIIQNLFGTGGSNTGGTCSSPTDPNYCSTSTDGQCPSGLTYNSGATCPNN